MSGHFSLPYRMLRRGRVGVSSLRVRDRGAISQCPNAFVALYLQKLVCKKPTMVQACTAAQQSGIGRGTGRPNDRAGRDPGAVAQFHPAIVNTEHTGVDTDFNLSLGELRLGIRSQVLA